MRTQAALSLMLCTLFLAAATQAAPVHLWSHKYGDFDDQFADACVAGPAGTNP
jgi:hypothetical protein